MATELFKVDATLQQTRHCKPSLELHCGYKTQIHYMNSCPKNIVYKREYAESEDH